MTGVLIPGNPYHLRPSARSAARRADGRGGSGRVWALLIGGALLLAFQGGGDLPAGYFSYTSDQDGDFDIHLASTGGEYIAQLTDIRGADWEAEWSPDALWLIFSSNRIDPDRYDIYLTAPFISLEEGEPFNGFELFSDPFADDGGPAINPRCDEGQCPGDIILFHSDRDGDYDLYFTNFLGRDFIQLTDDPGDELYPAFSPDGQRIAYMSNQSDNYWDIFVMDLVSGDVEQYTDSGGVLDLWPAWSPDGETIAWVSDETGWYRVWLMDAECRPGCGANQRLLLPPGQYPGEVNEFDPAWSLDGEWVLFSSYRDLSAPSPDEQTEFDYEIFAARADGRGLVQLTDNPWDDYMPAWMPWNPAQPFPSVNTLAP